MAIDLHSTPIVTNLAVALYMLSISIFPLWWSSFSERLGRRSIYVVSFLLFIVFSVLAAVSSNVTMLIVMRAFAGGAAASVQAVGAGTIADVWEVHERGRAMGWFYLGPLMGPLLAPVIGGSLSQHFGWQATMWFLAIYGAVIWLFIVFCLPETLVRRAHKPQQPATAGPQPPATEEQEDRGPAVDAAGASEQPLGLTRTRSAARSLQEQTSRAANIFKQVIVDPLALVLYLRFPAVLATVLFAGVAFGSLFVLNISIQSTFSSPPYAYPQLIVGVLYVPPSIGYILGSVLGGPWMDYIMARNARRAGRRDPETGKLLYLPEQRLGENAWTAASVYPTALIAYGWMVQKGVHWAGPSVANLLFGFGSMLIFGCATTMLTEFMPRQSSSGVALNNFVRNILSCVSYIPTPPLR